jgi:zinc protease
MHGRVAALILVCGGVAAGAPGVADEPPAVLAVTPPTLALRQYQLANGFALVLHEDHSVPVVNVQVVYHVGSKDEPAGRSGFAHLFEHIMFKGSANLGPGEHQSSIGAIGGRSNATTDFDRTSYYQTFPSNYLERVLWMEADRMRSLEVSEENFRSEREVVKEERRSRIESPPFGRLLEVVLDSTFTTHPYRRLSIGSMADLDAATLEDVRAFHRTYYVPDNATLVVTGDVDPPQVLAWAERYFGDIPRGERPISRAVPAEPAQTAERRKVDHHPNTPLPAVMLTFHVPEAGTADSYALAVASKILSAGESSRLHRRLVYDLQMAVDAGGEILALEDPGVFFFYAILQEGQQAAAGERELVAEAARIQDEPVTPHELAKAKNQIVADLVFGRQSVEDKGGAIANAAVILGDPTLVNGELAEYQRVTAADVQRVARQYFQPANRTVVYFLPPEPAESARTAPPAPGAGAAARNEGTSP